MTLTKGPGDPLASKASDPATPASAAAGSSDYRTGTAARLAGLPVETLRVWERRYGISDTARSARGQRLYSDSQVRRLALIKQLVDHGHGVGSLARLSDEALRALLPPSSAAGGVEGGGTAPVRVALVGDALVRRLAAGGRELFALDIVAAWAGLDEAAGSASALDQQRAEVLLIELAELSDAAVAPIAALRAASGAAAVVLYRFGARPTLARLRADGCIVAQAPADLAQLVLLCEAARLSPVAPPARDAAAGAALPMPPRFDDASLASLTTMPNGVSCECPRHLADLLMMLASFERYSGDCAGRTPQDAALHEELRATAGHARMLLEAALERLARAEGLPLLPLLPVPPGP